MKAPILYCLKCDKPLNTFEQTRGYCQEHDRDRDLIERGKELVKKYGKGARLNLTPWQGVSTVSPDRIDWDYTDPRGGIGSLLHELGHINTNKWRKNAYTLGELMEVEFDCWVWAYDTAEKEGIEINHENAYWKWSTYNRPNWDSPWQFELYFSDPV